MASNIYFGEVEVINLKTKEKRVIERQVFKDTDKPNDPNIRASVLRSIRKDERDNYAILKLKTETAKHLGVTAI